MPRYGFNFQWMYYNQGTGPQEPDEKALDFLAQHGFDFVRIPTNYTFWTTDFNYFEPDESVLAYLDRYQKACQQRGLHMSLNLHRAPGYCINYNDREKHNLWQDEIAQDAFIFLWTHFAERFKGISNDYVSFDLVNEPPEVGQYGMTRDVHANLMRRVVAAIREVDPGREIVIDGLGGGHLAMPELADLGVIHSGRGYQPMPVSHWGAHWWTGWQEAESNDYPGTEWDGKIWNKEVIHEFYKPWRDVSDMGVPVHIGEFGCYNKTPNDVALRWLGDVMSLYKEYGWGYGMWNFEGDFGIINHGRPGAVYETVSGYQVDRDLLELMLECQIKD